MTVRELFRNIANIENTELRIDYICSTCSYLGTFGIKFCDKCGTAFLEGYYDGANFYCSDACLHDAYSPKEWAEMTEGDYSEAYWSDWTELDDAQSLADAYNDILLPALRKAEEIQEEKRNKPSLYTFWTYDSLFAFCDKSSGDDRRIWYRGDLDTFNDELYTLQELMDEAEEDWFNGDDPVMLWKFKNR